MIERLAEASRRLARTFAVGLAALVAATGCTPRSSDEGLTAFASDAELIGFLRSIRPPFKFRELFEAQTLNMVTEDAAAAATGDAITNTQEAGVDEGGIVKARGDLLVVLRRGRLFTVSTKEGLKPIDSINAFPPGGGGNSWYDEMLLADDWIVVVGYDYEREGAELNRFRLSPEGRLSYVDSHFLRSVDYYSSENYTSRLIGRKLIVYSIVPTDIVKDNPYAGLPTLIRQPRPGEPKTAPRIIARAKDMYRAPGLRRSSDSAHVIHSVTSCDLTAPVLDCSAVGVVGPLSRTLYASPSAVYLWVGEIGREPTRTRAASHLLRMPYDGGRPSAIGIRGGPIDQFSFREDAADGVLNVLVQSDGGGDGMWRSEFGEGALSLARVPLSAFGDGTKDLPVSAYRMLPTPPENAGARTNRYVGDHLLYGTGRRWDDEKAGGSTAWAVPVRGGEIVRLQLPHAASRIDAMGRDAIVVGSGSDQELVFSTIELTKGVEPRLGDRYVRRAASEAETRSHAFFYRPDPEATEGDSGILGLPIAREGRPAYSQLSETSSAMIFLRRDSRRLAPASELAASDRLVEDGCIASCTDWYGNARPIFLRGRIFALMGYELVEGRLEQGRVVEIRRTDFTPPPRKAVGGQKSG